MAFFEDNLLSVHGGLTHHGDQVTADEDLSPTLENPVVVLWLHLIHPGLSLLVKQKYGSELHNKTLASLEPEISQALGSLFDELRSIEDTKAMRIGNTAPRRHLNSGQGQPRRHPFLSCILCKTAGRTHNTPNLMDCRYLPDRDRQPWARSRMVMDDPDDLGAEECKPLDESSDLVVPPVQGEEPAALRVSIVQSPVLNTFYHEHPVPLTLDTGATSNMVCASSAKLYGFPITLASQMAHQADGVTPMDVIGEVHCSLTRGQWTFELDALVVRQLDVDILAGNPFMVLNDIGVRPGKRQTEIGGTEIISYSSPSRHTRQPNVRCTQSFLLRNPNRTVVLPGEYVQFSTPSDTDSDTLWVLEPRLDCPSNMPRKPEVAWPPPQQIQSVDHAVRVSNTTNSPILLKSSEQLCQVRHILPVEASASTSPPTTCHAACVIHDPDGCLDQDTRDKFIALNLEFDDVFNPSISKYNGASGKIKAVVNIGPTLEELQDKFHELEAAGIFAKPEHVNVHVEYLNTSFLVKKPNSGSRLITYFGEVAQYSKPQPSLMPNVDCVLREIGKWKYIVITDLLKSFYQIPLANSSMKYCGVTTPFKGIGVYTRSAMGMPWSETCLEELMSQVLGDLIQEGCVAKIAHDLYIGGNNPIKVLDNWRRVLALLQKNNLRLSAAKTIICPRKAIILGWVWSNGTLQASPHKLATLSSVEPPSTVQGLQSFIGAYKLLSCVLPRFVELFDPLDQATAGKESREKLVWCDELLLPFKTAQHALADNRTITIPQPQDALWIVTDSSVKNRCIAATLYVHRNGSLPSVPSFVSIK